MAAVLCLRLPTGITQLASWLVSCFPRKVSLAAVPPLFVTVWVSLDSSAFAVGHCVMRVLSCLFLVLVPLVLSVFIQTALAYTD